MLLASCSHPAPATAPLASPCDRIDRRQRVGTHSFRRCIWTDDGAIGVVTEPEGAAFRIVFEPRIGAPVISAPLALTNARAEDVVVLPPPPGKAIPVTFAKYQDRIQPAPLGDPLPVQTSQFFASMVGSAPAVWTGLEKVGPKHYRLSFRLPDLRWQEELAYGEQADRALSGVEARVVLGERYELEGERDLRAAVTEACHDTPTLDWAKPDQLWAAAQCERIRGAPVAVVLEHASARCGVLARQALPSLKALSELHRRERDALSVEPRDLVLATEKLALSDPPSACFATDPLWNADYTARARPIEPPPPVLTPGWKEGLDALVPAAKR